MLRELLPVLRGQLGARRRRPRDELVLEQDVGERRGVGDVDDRRAVGGQPVRRGDVRVVEPRARDLHVGDRELRRVGQLAGSRSPRRASANGTGKYGSSRLRGEHRLQVQVVALARVDRHLVAALVERREVRQPLDVVPVGVADQQVDVARARPRLRRPAPCRACGSRCRRRRRRACPPPSAPRRTRCCRRSARSWRPGTGSDPRTPQKRTFMTGGCEKARQDLDATRGDMAERISRPPYFAFFDGFTDQGGPTGPPTLSERRVALPARSDAGGRAGRRQMRPRKPERRPRPPPDPEASGG